MPWKELEKRREYKRRWYATHKEEHKEKVNAYRKTHPHIMAKIQRKINYGITQEQYEALLEAQGSMCWICEKSFSDVKATVDHDHVTKVVRGILCNNCNLGLGRFSDNVSYLRQAIAYLEKGKV